MQGSARVHEARSRSVTTKGTVPGHSRSSHGGSGLSYMVLTGYQSDAASAPVVGEMGQLWVRIRRERESL